MCKCYGVSSLDVYHQLDLVVGVPVLFTTDYDERQIKVVAERSTDNSCKGCCFKEDHLDEMMGVIFCTRLCCGDTERSDKQSVTFKLLGTSFE